MEEQSDFVQRELLELSCMCSVCREIWEQPKTLQCKHTYCKECIEDGIEFEETGRPMLTCPECRHITVLGVGEVVGNLQCQQRDLDLLQRLISNTTPLVSLDHLNVEIKKPRLTLNPSFNFGIECCCLLPVYHYCWSCDVGRCTQYRCTDHFNTSPCCSAPRIILLAPSRRLGEYRPQCGVHEAFNTKGCLTCAVTFCLYCGLTQHDGHQVVPYEVFTHKFSKPIIDKLDELRRFVNAQSGVLDGDLQLDLNTKLTDIQRFIARRKILLLSQVLLALHVLEKALCEPRSNNSYSLSSTSFDCLFDTEISVNTALFNTLLTSFGATHIPALQDPSDSVIGVLRSSSMHENSSENLNPILHPVSINTYTEAERYVNDFLFKVNQHTCNVLKCSFPDVDVTEKEGFVSTFLFSRSSVRLLMPVLFSLDLCEKKILRKFQNRSKEFKSLIASLKMGINKNIEASCEAMKELQELKDDDVIYVMANASKVLQNHSKVNSILFEGVISLPYPDIQFEESMMAVQTLDDVVHQDFVRTALGVLCQDLDMDLSELYERFDPLFEENEMEPAGRMNIFWSQKHAEHAESYIHRRLKEMGLHNIHLPDFQPKGELLEQLMEDYPLEACRNALFLSNNSVESANELLLQDSSQSLNKHFILDNTARPCSDLRPEEPPNIPCTSDSTMRADEDEPVGHNSTIVQRDWSTKKSLQKRKSRRDRREIQRKDVELQLLYNLTEKLCGRK